MFYPSKSTFYLKQYRNTNIDTHNSRLKTDFGRKYLDMTVKITNC